MKINSQYIRQEQLKNLLHIYGIVLILLTLTLSSLSCDSKVISSSKHPNQDTLDSIVALREASRDKTSYSLEERFLKAEKARRLSNNLGIDSTIIKSNKRITFFYREMKNYNLFKKTHKETLELSHKIKDSASIAYVHFSLGYFFHQTLENDSAYYHYYNAEKMYRAIKDNFKTGSVLKNMAIVQKNEKDFIGSEITLINAIELIEPLAQEDPKLNNSLAGAYNNLAILSKELEQYDDAIKYYDNAISVLKKSSNFSDLEKLNQLSNLGVTYEASGDSKKALELFKSLLNEDDLLTEDASFYAQVLNNYTRNKFLLNKYDKDLPALYFKALAIRDSIGNKGGIMRSNINIAEYYLAHEHHDKAIGYANRAYEIAKMYDFYDDQLETLLLLSKIEQGDKGLVYTHRHIALNDSLQKQERAIRNKFARIKYETDNYIKEAKRLTGQKAFILSTSIAMMLMLLTLYLIKVRHSKIKALQYQQHQQKANEDIYQLMLNQHSKLDEGRREERRRISEELHDGIIGKLFATRMNLGFLKLESNPTIKTKFKSYIQQIEQTEKDIRQISHELNHDIHLNELDIDTMMQQFLDSTTKAHRIKHHFKSDNDIHWENISGSKKVHLYRILQEATQNTIKHAKAKNLSVTLIRQEDSISLSIKDDGVGYNTYKKHKGIGLKNIASRVNEIHGKLLINSNNKNGTHMVVTFKI